MSGPIYEVEKIIGKRAGKKGTEYHIHWRGYTDKYDSWEPEQNLLDCEELISNFEANLKASAKQPATRSTPLLSSEDEASPVDPPVKKRAARKSPARKQQRRAKSPARRPKRKAQQAKEAEKVEEDSPVMETEELSVVTKTVEKVIPQPEVTGLFESRKYSLRSTQTSRTYTSSSVAFSSDEEEAHKPRPATTRMSLSQSNLRRRLADVASPAPQASVDPAHSVSSTLKNSARARLTFDTLRSKPAKSSQGMNEEDYPAAAEEKIIPPHMRSYIAPAEGTEPEREKRIEYEQRVSGRDDEGSPLWMQIGYAELVFAVIVTVICCFCIFGYQLGYF